MARKSTFVKGSSTFKCTCCGHLTRWTGEQGTDSKVCVPCWDLAGLENAFQDNTLEDFKSMGYDKEVASIMGEIRKRSAEEYEKAKKSFDMLSEFFPAEGEAETEVEAPKVVETTESSTAAKPVTICREIKAAHPEYTRKQFIEAATARGVHQATASAQFHRIKL